jgi:hypothetical protein
MQVIHLLNLKREQNKKADSQSKSCSYNKEIEKWKYKVLKVDLDSGKTLSEYKVERSCIQVAGMAFEARDDGNRKRS